MEISDSIIPKIVTLPEVNEKGHHLKKKIYKLPRTMKKVPFRKMEQNWHLNFRWWFYDGSTGEAVIVLQDGSGHREIRVFDPMWLVNLSCPDITRLWMYPIYHQSEDKEQALQFKKVVKVCFANDINSGSEWTLKKGELF